MSCEEAFGALEAWREGSRNSRVWTIGHGRRAIHVELVDRELDVAVDGAGISISAAINDALAKLAAVTERRERRDTIPCPAMEAAS